MSSLRQRGERATGTVAPLLPRSGFSRWPRRISLTDSTYERIYAVVRRIPIGHVSTYGRIAVAARANGPRQVGYALHSLGGGTSVPWHRVVSATGGISVRGATAITQELKLDAEGVVVGAGGRIDLGRFGWTPGSRRKG